MASVFPAGVVYLSKLTFWVLTRYASTAAACSCHSFLSLDTFTIP